MSIEVNSASTKLFCVGGGCFFEIVLMVWLVNTLLGRTLIPAIGCVLYAPTRRP